MTGTEKTGVKDHPDKKDQNEPRKGRQMLLRGFSFSPDQTEGLFRLIGATGAPLIYHFCNPKQSRPEINEEK